MVEMKINRTVLSTVIAFGLVACSPVESDLKEFLKCGMAANKLSELTAADMINKKMGQYIRENHVDGTSRDAMYLGQEVREDLELYAKNPKGRFFTLAKVYNSSICLEMHEQEKIEMPFLYYLAYIFI
ncbi:hypothetical protein QDG88_08270 [Pseudoalteromonas piscicida]|uniref:hypothetical protein n=1 Tax=Pseudoalteromonas piscicida TaxID=43662 RepID=UPI00273881A7|nr:hypothetical protein [Pseudoalteromonas piscicida]MDP4487937.1 hypothetical protein [Pseudoalteromonas piscicida]